MLSTKEAAEPGPYRVDRTPYVREILECLSPSSDVEEVDVMKGAQIGFTTVGNVWLGFVIHRAPGPFLYVEPTVESAKAVSKQRIANMIETIPALADRIAPSRARDSGNTILMKEFAGGFLKLIGANSGAGFRQVPIRYLFLDDLDGFPPYVEGEGDPEQLGRARTTTFASNRKILKVSTPTLQGASRIARNYERTDQRRYFVPCPHCGHFDWIRWSRIVWPEGRPREAQLQCEACEQLIPERAKTELLARGEWRPTAEPENPRVRGYHLSGLYSPAGWKTWGDCAEEFLAAKRDGREALQSWTNTVLGETWEEQGDSIDDTGLYARREPYEGAPLEVLVVTAGIDVQDDRLEVEIVGWGMGEESWGLDYRVLHGDPTKDQVWEQLHEALEQRFERADGAQLGVAGAGLDTNYATHRAYGFARAHAARNVYALRGMAGAGRALVSSPSQKKSGRQTQPVRLFTVGVDEAKGTLYSRLKLTTPGPGYCHFPVHEGYDPEYFAQLASEKRVIRYHRGFPTFEWRKVRARNETLDCRVYAMAALVILNPAWSILAKRVGPRREAAPGRPAPAASELRRPRRVARGPYATRWRNW